MKKILFVDDDMNLLKSLERTLKQFSETVNMVFMHDPIEAQKMISENFFDIVIADYKMPSINGIEFLKYVMKVSPKTKRILLTGQSDAEIYDKAREIVHTYLAKPCDHDELLLALEI